jgi:hypothetical protein
VEQSVIGVYVLSLSLWGAWFLLVCTLLNYIGYIICQKIGCKIIIPMTRSKISYLGGKQSVIGLYIILYGGCMVFFFFPWGAQMKRIHYEEEHN